MSLSPVYHVLGKAMQGEPLNQNQVKYIVAAIRSDERKRIVKLVEDWLDDDQGDLKEVLNIIKTGKKNTEKGQK